MALDIGINTLIRTNSPSHVAITGMLCLAIAMGIGRFAFTPLLPLMREDGLLTIEQGGWLASLHFLGYLLGALYAARLPYSPRQTLRLSLIVIGVSTLAMGLTSNLYLWLAFRFAAGLASALILVLISNFYVKQLAQTGQIAKQGWVFSGVGLGIAIVGLGTLIAMVGGIGSSASWKMLGLASLIVVLVVCLKTGSEIPEVGTTSAQMKSQRSPVLWSLVIPYGAAGIGYIIPATYLPVMAREIIASPSVFGWAWPVFGAAALVSTLLAIRLQSRFSIRQIWFASHFVMAFGLLLPVIYPQIPSIILAGVCVGGTFMVITMMGMKETHRLAPTSDIMRHVAIMTAAFAIGQMIGPVLASSVYAYTFSFSISLLIASGTLIATAMMLLVTTPR